jgi:histidinol dehydrogenase
MRKAPPPAKGCYRIDAAERGMIGFGTLGVGTLGVGTIEDHRSREGGKIIYPVYSRRSGGLSVGINLFPDHKRCSFDCPYCEVFPFETDIIFKLEVMKTALRSAILDARERNLPVKDLCFSGNGEPTMSPHFTEALEAAAAIRNELAAEAKLVVITNGTGLLDPSMFEFLKLSAEAPASALWIWLKLDAGTGDWYAAMDRSGIPYGRLVSRIREFAASGAPFIVQTMVCAIKGRVPPPEEGAAWTALVTDLAAASGLRAVQIYGKARPAPEDPLAQALPAAVLEDRAALLRAALRAAGSVLPVEVYA